MPFYSRLFFFFVSLVCFVVVCLLLRGVVWHWASHWFLLVKCFRMAFLYICFPLSCDPPVFPLCFLFWLLLGMYFNRFLIFSFFRIGRTMLRDLGALQRKRRVLRTSPAEALRPVPQVYLEVHHVFKVWNRHLLF